MFLLLLTQTYGGLSNSDKVENKVRRSQELTCSVVDSIEKDCRVDNFTNLPGALGSRAISYH